MILGEGQAYNKYSLRNQISDENDLVSDKVKRDPKYPRALGGGLVQLPQLGQVSHLKQLPLAAGRVTRKNVVLCL